MHYRLILLGFLSLAAACSSRSSDDSDIRQCAPPIAAESDQFKKYVYPFYKKEINHPGLTAAGSGFFIQYQNRYYFITARHTIYDTGKRKVLLVESINIKSNTNADDRLSIDLTKPGREPVSLCNVEGCFDVVAIAIDNKDAGQFQVVPATRMAEDDTARGSAVFIPGYPNDQYKLVSTRLVSWNGMFDRFYTEKASSFQASGAPVFILTQNKEMILAGIYNGHDEAQNYGVVTKADVMVQLLMEIR